MSPRRCAAGWPTATSTGREGRRRARELLPGRQPVGAARARPALARRPGRRRRSRRYRADHGIDASWPTRERVVVALSGGPEGETLLRRGARIASRGAGGELLAVHVARSDGLSGRPAARPRDPAPAHRRARRLLAHRDRRRSGRGDPRRRPRRQRDAGRHRQHPTTTVARPWRCRAPPKRSSPTPATSTCTSSPTPSPHGRGWRVPRAALPRRRIRLGYAASVVGPIVLTGLLVLLPPGPRPAPDRAALPAHDRARRAARRHRPARSWERWPRSLLLNWFFLEPVRTLTISEPENAVALVVFVVVAVVVAFVVHTSARRAERAVAAQRESAALAELTHTLLGSTDQMTVLLEHALDMFGAQRAVVMRRGDGRPAGRGRASRWSPTPSWGRTRAARGPDGTASGDSEQTRTTADDEHDLVLVGVPGARRPAAAARRVRGARGRDPPAARPPAGGRRGRGPRPGQLGPDGAALGGVARPAHPAGRHQGRDRQPAVERGDLLGRGRGRARGGDRGLRRPARRARRQPARHVAAPGGRARRVAAAGRPR